MSAESGAASAGRTTIEQVLAAVPAGGRRYLPAEALAAQEAGALLVDTRSADDLRVAGVVPGSLHVPLSVLPWRADPGCPWHDAALARLDAEVILVCAHGYSSSLAAALLRHIGFSRAGDVVGGFEAWAAAGLPVEPAPLRPR